MYAHSAESDIFWAGKAQAVFPIPAPFNPPSVRSSWQSDKSRITTERRERKRERGKGGKGQTKKEEEEKIEKGEGGGGEVRCAVQARQNEGR